jgi:predicted tellurium resistance membrane protein TerC
MLDLIQVFLSPEALIALMTLSAMEIVLGIDNLILLSILSDKLPEHQQALARRIGLIAALGTRLLLLSLIFWISKLNQPIFTLMDVEISFRDLLLIAGGIFLIAKATHEMHEKIEGASTVNNDQKTQAKTAVFGWIIVQIAIMDIVFSFDSVMTAIGMVNQMPVMIAAILISMVVMVLSVEKISAFIKEHPTVKILALSYMMLIGMALVGEGLTLHIPKGYLYFAMGFSFLVEAINIVIRKKNNKASA